MAERGEAGQEKSTTTGAGAAAATPDASSSGGQSEVDADPLTAALNSLFTSFADVVQGELQCSNSEYELLKDMNLRTATEYDNFGDFASGLRIFVEKLKHKNETFDRYLQEIDGIDNEVTELEALVATLDTYTRTLHVQIKDALANA